MPASRFAAWAGDPTAERVTGVIRVIERPNPSVSSALGAAAVVTRGAAPKVTGVTTPRPSAIEVTQITQSTTPALPRKPIADQYSNPGNLSNPQEEQCTTSGDDAANPVWWCDLFEQLAALRQLNGGRPREDAEVLAFRDTILEWHHRYGARPDSRRCPGCGDELGDEAGLVLCDGARVHLDGVRGVNCLITYGQQWRGAALVALRVLGLDPPEGFTWR
jgi:hypothetical protein